MSQDNLILLQNCHLLDTRAGTLLPDYNVLIEGSRIKEVGDQPLKAEGALVLDLGGRTLMPGLADAHVHVTAVEADFAKLAQLPPSYITARTAGVLKDMLYRGFTTVRDAGGADWGLARAVQEGYLLGPRILYSGPALSQTGGHGDTRPRGDDNYPRSPAALGTLGRLCDGVDEVRRAAREEIRNGATQLKIMASGGVASPNDPIAFTQFSRAEIEAMVEEAEAACTYVMAHAYTARAIKRCLEGGVRSIEHGNLLDDDTLALLRQKDAFLVPTLVTFEILNREGQEAGFSPSLLGKVKELHAHGLAALEKAYRRGVRIAFGTDLIGAMHRYQSLEFSLRAQVQSPADVIRSATVTCAELFNLEGEIGVIAPSARADVLVVAGNPLEDLNLLQEQGRYLEVIMKEGQMVVNRLGQ